jgi:hypothetical protein
MMAEFKEKMNKFMFESQQQRVTEMAKAAKGKVKEAEETKI